MVLPPTNRLRMFTALPSNGLEHNCQSQRLGVGRGFVVKRTKETLEKIPIFDLASAVKIFQEAALIGHGYPADHACDHCPHPEVSESFIVDLSSYLRRFPPT